MILEELAIKSRNIGTFLCARTVCMKVSRGGAADAELLYSVSESWFKRCPIKNFLRVRCAVALLREKFKQRLKTAEMCPIIRDPNANSPGVLK
jgi:hypothetical protein